MRDEATAPEGPGWARFLAFKNEFLESIPYQRALGMTYVSVAPGRVRMAMPHKGDLVGDPEYGVLHGGAVTSLIDACSGAAVFSALRELKPVATLDLRMDYVRPARAGRDIVADAHVYRITHSVAFTRCVALDHSEALEEDYDFWASGVGSTMEREHAVASSSGTFMLDTASVRGTDG